MNVPQGWKLVPENPTEAMMQAGLYQSSHDSKWEDVFSSWRDMLAIAPENTAEGKTMEMNWNKVADRLAKEAARLRSDAPSTFPKDLTAQQEMRTRASIFETFADALWDGLGHQRS